MCVIMWLVLLQQHFEENMENTEVKYANTSSWIVLGN